MATTSASDGVKDASGGEEAKISGFPKFHQARNTLAPASVGKESTMTFVLVVASLVVAVVVHRTFFKAESTPNERVDTPSNPRQSRTSQSRLLREMELRQEEEEEEEMGKKRGAEEQGSKAKETTESSAGSNDTQDDDLYTQGAATLTESKASSEPSSSENETKEETLETTDDVEGRKEATESGQHDESPAETAPPPPPPLKSQRHHPGLTEFHIWHNGVCDLYRSYVVGPADGNEIVPVPVLPKSERGVVPVELEVTNRTAHVMDVYWVDHLGGEQWKGYASPEGGIWRQTTWIGHPWIFRARGESPSAPAAAAATATSGKLLLHFVPFRVIPTTTEVSTVRPPDPKAPQRHDQDVGLQKFTLCSVRPNVQQRWAESPGALDPAAACQVDDPVLPFPSYRIQSVEAAVAWSCTQMEREDRSPATLLRYLRNILAHPDQSKYRRIRTSNPTFFNNVWINGGRGVLHALGFEEHGAHVEMGPDQGSLPPDRIKDVSSAIFQLELLQRRLDGPERPHQPQGADGFGRGGFGRAGQLNFRR